MTNEWPTLSQTFLKNVKELAIDDYDYVQCNDARHVFKQKSSASHIFVN